MSSSLTGTLSIAQLRQAFRDGLSPVDALRDLLGAIAADTNDLNAFVMLDEAAALAAAQASHERWRAGAPLGPLDGLPVSVKDMINVAGWPTRRGSLATADEAPAAEDAPVVQALRAAGAVVFGKTTSTEFGWVANSTSPLTGHTRNPHAPAHSSGGSSCGAAAQVAAGWGLLAIGTDAGGSVRIPASWCGLYGFKPTWGAIPQAPLSALGDLAHLGPLTRSLDDCIESMRALSHAHPRDPASLYSRADWPARPPHQLRIGYASRARRDAWIEPAVERAFDTQMDTLRAAGFMLEPCDMDEREAVDALWTYWKVRNFDSFVDWPESRLKALSPELLTFVEAARQVDVVSAAKARSVIRALVARMNERFARMDVLLMPTTPTTAPLVGELAPRGHPQFEQAQQQGNWFLANDHAYMFNLTGQPALSMPLGVNEAGLPFGLQIVGRKFRDAEVLGLARAIEALRQA